MVSESFLRSLYGLRLASFQRRPGNVMGERRSVRRGRSIEFADYRTYTPGDDPRRVDWNIYARLERPFVKLYEDEQDLTVHLLLDASPSMHWRDERDIQHNAPSGKWTRATQLAIAIGHIALTSGDRLIVELSNRERFGPRQGATATAELMSFIEDQSAELNAQELTGAAGPNRPALSLNSWWKRYALDVQPGICVIISDLFDPQGCNEGLTALVSARLEVRVLHTLCPAELEPEVVGDVCLKDSESGAAQEVSIDEALLRAYQNRLRAWSNSLNEQCRKRGARYHLTNTGAPIEQVVLRDLRREGWLI
ncbi:MAG: DUF58 domain-containing protein [Anaerolineae bacterium]|nr:DUF58 domain-containing protein [Thermoflexales bacterium]MDW8408100.1 DUF58 domain-containing protein [Anaerolineae bacterium]